MPLSSRMPFGAGAYMWVTMSPRLSSARIGAQRRIVLADVDHDRQIERRGRLLGAAQRLEVVGAGDVVRQPRLDADDDVAIARDGALRQRHVGAC